MRAAFRAAATVLTAHAFAYILIGELPRTGIGVLGIGAADQRALSEFNAQIDFPHSYIDALTRLFSWNFGKTLDQVNVSSVLQSAIMQSTPIFAVSTLMLAGCTLVALYRPQLFARAFFRNSFEFTTFIPAFLPGFLTLSIAVFFGSIIVFDSGISAVVILGICVGVTPSCLSVLVIRDGYELELSQRYVQVMKAYGYDQYRINVAIRKAVLLRWIPAWEKLLTLQLAVLIFTEAIFAYPGFGSLILLSVQRTDVNVILASIVAISVAVSCVRLISGIAGTLLEPRKRNPIAP